MADFNFIKEDALRRIVREMLQEGDYGSGAGGDTREKMKADEPRAKRILDDRRAAELIRHERQKQEVTASYKKMGIILPGPEGGPVTYTQKYFDDLAKKHGGTADQYKKEHKMK